MQYYDAWHFFQWYYVNASVCLLRSSCLLLGGDHFLHLDLGCNVGTSFFNLFETLVRGEREIIASAAFFSGRTHVEFYEWKPAPHPRVAAQSTDDDRT